MKTFFIIITMAVYTAINWSPDPCNVPTVFTYQVKNDTAFSDTCRPCAIQVFNAAKQQIHVPQLDHSGLRIVEEVRVDSVWE